MKKNIFCLITLFVILIADVNAQNTTCKPQCVAYAKSRAPSCPSALFSYQDKLNIINENLPMAGTVAIINVNNNQYGQVAYINNYLNGQVTLEETNCKADCAYGTRTGIPANLKIAGYFRPSATSSSPAVGAFPPSENGSRGNATGNTVKMKVQSLNNEKATFTAAKCNTNVKYKTIQRPLLPWRRAGDEV